MPMREGRSQLFGAVTVVKSKSGAKSGAELAEVVIGVEVAEAHPFLLGHGAEVGMIGPTKISRVPRETVEEVNQFRHIAVKVARGCAFALLVDLRQCLEALRPRDRHPQAAPLQESTRIGKAGRRYHDQSQVEFVSVAQVTDHLVRGHFSPATRTGGMNIVEARKDLIFVQRVEQGPHALASTGTALV